MELQQAQNRSADLRNACLTKCGELTEALQVIDLDIDRVKAQLQNLTIQRDDCFKSAKALSDASLGVEIPKSVSAQLAERQARLEEFDNRIVRLRAAHTI
jgi:hypothetical protein